jgi:two-component system cell cycle sensor histidine kinase/response regulator CckA
MHDSRSSQQPNTPLVEDPGGVPFLHRLSHLVTGYDRSGHHLEQWLFTWVMLLSECATLLAFIITALLKFHPALQMATSLAAILFGFFWFLSWRGISYTKLVYPATAALISFLSIAWIFNAGSRGGAQMFLLFCPLVFLVFTRGAGRIVTLVFFMAVMVFLLLLEHNCPAIIVGYTSELQRAVDHTTSFFIVMTLTIAFTLALHRGYRKVVAIADAEKRASENRFFETADMLPVGICEANRDLVVSFFNRAGYDLTGFTNGDFDNGHTVLDLLHPDDKAQASLDFNAILAGKQLPLHEYRFVRKDGKTLKILLQCDQVYARGSVVGLRMCLIDITDKKTLEEQYRQSQKMESVGLLAGGVAHDFNNILSAVLGYASLIRLENRQKDKAGYSPRLDEQITAILNAGDRATDLVRKLLAFSRQGSYEVKPLNIHTLIDEVVSLLAHSIDKRITITKALTAINPVVEGDRSLLQSTLLNLAINARDAMPEGGVLAFSTKCTTVVSAAKTKKNFSIIPGPYVSVTIADTGVGMDDNVKKHLFEPFFTTKEPGKGTGLGLASVFGTVTRHGGSVDVVSEKGRGTAITVQLPQATSAPASEKTPDPEKNHGRPLHIMMVDDESMICDFVNDFLATEGHTTTAFTNPAQAIEWYRQYYAKVDCIVLDMNMPVMDGRACFSAMRKINPEAKGIFATGFLVGETAEITRMPGIKGYIQKPFSLEDLVRAISLAVEGDIRPQDDSEEYSVIEIAPQNSKARL